MIGTVRLSCYASDCHDGGFHGVEIIHEREHLTRGRCACGAYGETGVDMVKHRSVNAALRSGAVHSYYLEIQPS